MLDKHFLVALDPKANENNIILYKDYRITLIFDRLIRIEKGNTYLDKATAAIINRNFEDVNYSLSNLDNGILITVNNLSYFNNIDLSLNILVKVASNTCC